MSWVIKADRKEIRTEEDALQVGDQVRILPWAGRVFDIPYDYLKVHPIWTVINVNEGAHPQWDKYVDYVTVKSPGGTDWIVSRQYVERI